MAELGFEPGQPTLPHHTAAPCSTKADAVTHREVMPTQGW